eukprot:365338-Chlamydomonas_euryale.AAC.45
MQACDLDLRQGCATCQDRSEPRSLLLLLRQQLRPFQRSSRPESAAWLCAILECSHAEQACMDAGPGCAWPAGAALLPPPHFVPSRHGPFNVVPAWARMHRAMAKAATERKERAGTEDKWKHDRFGVEDEEDEEGPRGFYGNGGM